MTPSTCCCCCTQITAASLAVAGLVHDSRSLHKDKRKKIRTQSNVDHLLYLLSSLGGSEKIMGKIKDLSGRNSVGVPDTSFSVQDRWSRFGSKCNGVFRSRIQFCNNCIILDVIYDILAACKQTTTVGNKQSKKRSMNCLPQPTSSLILAHHSLVATHC